MITINGKTHIYITHKNDIYHKIVSDFIISDKDTIDVAISHKGDGIIISNERLSLLIQKKSVEDLVSSTNYFCVEKKTKEFSFPEEVVFNNIMFYKDGYGFRNLDKYVLHYDDGETYISNGKLLKTIKTKKIRFSLNDEVLVIPIGLMIVNRT